VLRLYNADKKEFLEVTDSIQQQGWKGKEGQKSASAHFWLSIKQAASRQ